MSNRNLSLDALKSSLFETLEGVKNLSDPLASENEKLSVDQAKQIVDISGMDNVSSMRSMATALGGGR